MWEEEPSLQEPEAHTEKAMEGAGAGEEMRTPCPALAWPEGQEEPRITCAFFPPSSHQLSSEARARL